VTLPLAPGASRRLVHCAEAGVGSACSVRSREKVACTALSPVITTVQVGWVPEQAPDQPRKMRSPGVSVRTTVVPTG
jgi:hypothetical protein